MFKIVPNKKGCCAYRCKNPRPKKDRFCSKHRKRYNKEMMPESYTYSILKSNAKRRGKEFTLTLEEFKTFCQETGYLQGKGKKKKSMSIDRIDHTKGYSIDNIQILTLSENGIKGNTEKAPF